MDRQMLLDHLVEAEHRIAFAKNDIQEQYRLIAELMRNGEDTVEAVVLNQLIEAQGKHEADRDRLKAELAGNRRGLHLCPWVLWEGLAHGGRNAVLCA
jgi:hypothetical protein